MIDVRYFARLREAFGVETEAVWLPVATMDSDQVHFTLGALLIQLRARHGERADALLAPRIRVAIDGVIQAFDADTPLPERCEVAFLPPVTGG